MSGRTHALRRSCMIPAKYSWLNNIGTLPKMLDEALHEFGTIEYSGTSDNPRILAWSREIGVSGYSHDSIPWCGLFVGVCAWRARKPLPTNPLWALNWSKFGEDAGQPELGDVLVFTRNGGGHVGLYIGEDSTCYHVLGGNQSDAVSITRIEKTRLYAARNKYTVGPPASAKPYILEPTGVISEDER